MTKKRFEALAREIAEIEDMTARKLAARAVMRACVQFNPNFNRAVFLTKCGLLIEL